MENPSKKVRASSLTPAKMTSRQRDALELVLRRIGRACVIGEDEPSRCTAFEEAADRLQDRGRRAGRAAPPTPPAAAAPAVTAETKQEGEATASPPAPTYP